MAGESAPIRRSESGSFLPPQASDIAGFSESKGTVTQSVVRSGQIRAATTTIQDERSKLAQFLSKNGILLWTSAVQFQQNGDFILSSYVEYTQHNYMREPLQSFLQRYPQLKPMAEEIKNSVSAQQQNMNVVSPRLSGLRNN